MQITSRRSFGVSNPDINLKSIKQTINREYYELCIIINNCMHWIIICQQTFKKNFRHNLNSFGT